jgi:hypothetical protein
MTENGATSWRWYFQEVSLIHLTALLATLSIEGGGMALLAWLLPGWRPRWRAAGLLALTLNLVSHTIFWYALPLLPLPPATAIPVAEGIVIAAEGAVYAATVARPAWSGWAVSLALNYASWVLSSYLWR